MREGRARPCYSDQMPRPDRRARPRRRSPLPFIVLAAFALVAAVLALRQWNRDRPADEPAAKANAAAPVTTPPAPSVDPPAASPPVPPIPPPAPPPTPSASRSTADALPPIPIDYGSPPPRPLEVVRAVHEFAAAHPEVLSYVPCFCGCERGGHRSNADCFIAARDARGRVTEWDPHGVG